jgi:hypothetical protein
MKGTVAPPSSSSTAATICAGRPSARRQSAENRPQGAGSCPRNVAVARSLSVGRGRTQPACTASIRRWRRPAAHAASHPSADNDPQRRPRRPARMVSAAVARAATRAARHAGAGAPDPGLQQAQPAGLGAPVLFPDRLLHRMSPAQGDLVAELRHQQPGDETDAVHAASATGLRLRSQCQAMNSAATARPIWSVSGTAATSSPAPAAATTRSQTASGARR